MQCVSCNVTSSLNCFGGLAQRPFPSKATRHQNLLVRCQATSPNSTVEKTLAKGETSRKDKGIGGLGDVLGPIGLTIGASAGDTDRADDGRTASPSGSTGSDQGVPELHRPQSISKLTTQEWREAYEKDGYVDLWVEEEFNSGSRLIGGRRVHNGGVYGWRSGEGPSAGNVPSHTVKIYNHYADQEIEVEVPEDRYVLWEAEDQGLELPYACRMGCCTACAVRVKEGELYQPQALGISEELKREGYALMCVAYPRTDVVLETVAEDEVYDLQFGRYFEAMALDVNSDSIERDDFALEVANMDE